jgi:UDPglucose 6-dehydrogenase
LNRPEQEFNFKWQGKIVGLIGLAFKRDTDDIRNSGALGVTRFLLEKNVESICAYDPAAGNNFLKYFSSHLQFKKIELVGSEVEAIKNSDVIIIASDWPQFRELSDAIKQNLKSGSLIMDGRRMLSAQYQELSNAGYLIIAVGSPVIKKNN